MMSDVMQYLELLERIKKSVAVDLEAYGKEELEKIRERYNGFWHEGELLIPHKEVACIEFKYDKDEEYTVLRMKDGGNLLSY